MVLSSVHFSSCPTGFGGSKRLFLFLPFLQFGRHRGFSLGVVGDQSILISD